MLHKKFSAIHEVHILQGQFVDLHQLPCGEWEAHVVSADGLAGYLAGRSPRLEDALAQAESKVKEA